MESFQELDFEKEQSIQCRIHTQTQKRHSFEMTVCIFKGVGKDIYVLMSIYPIQPQDTNCFKH